MSNTPTRRDALKKILVISTASCIALLGASHILNSGPKVLHTIKVAYFGMTVQTTGTKEEYFTLPAPVYLQGILSRIKEEHVVLGVMLPTMAVVINGIPADGNPRLENNSEIDLIPTFAGG